MNKAIFIDRDGVINRIHYNEDLGLCTPHTAEEFEFMPFAEDSIKMINLSGFKAIGVCNQPDVSKGRLTMKAHEEINQKMVSGLKSKNAKLDGIYYCFHKSEDNCECRKPKPGMLLKAAKDFDIDLKKSWIIGDTLSDIQAGKSAGCRTVLIGNPRCDLCRVIQENNCRPDFIVKGLPEAVKAIQKAR